MLIDGTGTLSVSPMEMPREQEVFWVQNLPCRYVLQMDLVRGQATCRFHLTEEAHRTVADRLIRACETALPLCLLIKDTQRIPPVVLLTAMVTAYGNPDGRDPRTVECVLQLL